MNQTYSCQFAIRSTAEGVHVQLVASKDLFHNGYTRSYGAAFNVKNESLTAAVAAGNPTLKSKAGTDRRYVPGLVVISGKTMTFTVKGQPAADLPKIFAAAVKPTEKSVLVYDTQIS